VENWDFSLKKSCPNQRKNPCIMFVGLDMKYNINISQNSIKYVIHLVEIIRSLYMHLISSFWKLSVCIALRLVIEITYTARLTNPFSIYQFSTPGCHGILIKTQKREEILPLKSPSFYGSPLKNPNNICYRPLKSLHTNIEI